MSSLKETLAKIQSFISLPQGWDNGRNGPPSVLAMIGARSILKMLQSYGVSSFDAVPGDGRGVVVFGFADGAEIEVICGADSVALVYARSPLGEESEIEDSSYHEAMSFIGALNWLTKKSSILSAYNVILSRQAVSVAKPSPSRVTGAVFRSYAQNVSEKRNARYVSTLPNTQSEVSDQIRQYFGDSECQILQALTV